MLMLTEEGSLAGVTVCDAGCGTGLLSIPLAKEGVIVSASDISAAMVAEAEMKSKQQLAAENLPRFEVNDLESLSGKYNTVVCLDVLIHYPQNKADGMIAHLASLAEKRVILSFAPKTFYYDILKRIGELFPGPSKATRVYLHAEADVERVAEGRLENQQERTYYHRVLLFRLSFGKNYSSSFADYSSMMDKNYVVNAKLTEEIFLTLPAL